MQKFLLQFFSPIFHLHCFRQVASIFTFISDFSIKLLFLKCLRSIEKNENYIWKLCTKTTRNNIVRHKKRCSAGTLYCTQCPNFSTWSQNDLNYHSVKKHTAQKLDVIFKCKPCYQEFSGFHALRQHRKTQHGMQIGSKTRDVDAEHIVGDVEGHKMREELRSCQHLLLDSKLERARHKVFNYAMENLNAEIVYEGIDHFFNNLRYAAKVNLVFGFILRKIEDRGFR